MITTKPEPWQIEGAKFLYKKHYGILGFKTGRGKTLTVLACINHYVSGQEDYAVVFGPKGAIEKTWPAEIAKHTDMRWVTFDEKLVKRIDVEGMGFLLKEYDIVLFSISVAVKYSNHIEPLTRGRITSFDECHKIKSPSAKMVRALAYTTKKARAKWGLTATAISNHLMDLWGIMETLALPLENPLGSERQFKRNFCVMEEKVVGRNPNKTLKKARVIAGYKNLDKFREIISEFMMLVESDLSVQFHELQYKMTQSEEETYLLAAWGILEGEANYKEYAQRMADIQRAADGSRVRSGETVVDLLQTGEISHELARSSKYTKYLEKVREILHQNESCLIFCENLDTYDYVKVMLEYDLPDDTNFYQVSSRQMDNPETFKTPCVILGTGAGSESLNLKMANHVLMYSLPFSVEQFIQRVGRIARMDSEYTEDLNVYLPMEDTNIDKYKKEYLLMNAQLIHEVLGKEANLPLVQLKEDRKKIIQRMRKELLWRKREYEKQKKKLES